MASCLFQWTGVSRHLKQQLGLIKILLILEATLRVGTTYCFVYKNANDNSLPKIPFQVSGITI